MLIFGFGPGKGRDLGAVARAVCPSCRNEVFFHHVQSKKALRLYFVPVVPYGTDDYLLCPICSNGMLLDDDEVEAVEAMKQPTARFQTGDLGEAEYGERLAWFWHRLGITESPVPVPTPQSSPASAPAREVPVEDRPPPEDRSWVDKLADLERLRSEGVLDDAQFEAARCRLLGE